jgi:hypothetical protein
MEVVFKEQVQLKREEWQRNLKISNRRKEILSEINENYEKELSKITNKIKTYILDLAGIGAPAVEIEFKSCLDTCIPPSGFKHGWGDWRDIGYCIIVKLTILPPPKLLFGKNEPTSHIIIGWVADNRNFILNRLSLEYKQLYVKYINNRLKLDLGKFFLKEGLLVDRVADDKILVSLCCG